MNNTNTAVTIALTGDITHANSSQWHERLLAALHDVKGLVVDAADLRMLSSAGLRMLLLLHRTAASRGQLLALAALPAAARDVMSVTGFLQHFAVYDNVEEAQKVLQAQP